MKQIKKELPPEDHISRWCKSIHVDQGEIGIGAFMLEEKDLDDALSVNWLEFLKCKNREEEITEVQNILSQKMKKINKRSRIAVLNVGEIKTEIDKCLNGKLKVSVLHDPVKDPQGAWDDPSHSGINGLTRDESERMVAATALRDKIEEIHLATKT